MSEYLNISAGILNVDIDIQDPSWKNKDRLQDLVTKVSQVVLNKLGLTKEAKTIEFSLVFTNNDAIQKLNLQYRGKDSPTNTLSFPVHDLDPKKIDKNIFHDGFIILGDIIFAFDVIEKETKEQGKDFYNHFSHLLVHGILHLLGYDHESLEEAEVMEALEIDILSSLDIQSPY
jgi:probable rRNA maturation factor